MKHKRIFRTLLMAICATMAGVPFTSCSDSETESTDVTESAKVALSISASKQNSSGTDARKADYDAEDFEDGDEIGLYVLLAEDKQSAYIDEETCYNVRATYDGSSWTLDNVIYLSEDEAYIIAYYPYDESIGHTMYTSEEGTLLFDLTLSDDDNLQTDVLASEGVPVSSDSPEAALKLSHVLTRITLTIEVADDITTSGTLTSMSISADELYSDVGLYIDEDGSFQTYSTTKADDLTLSLNETLSGGDDTTVDFLIPSESSTTISVALVIDGTTYSFEIEEDEWAAGYQYSYNVTITTGDDDGDGDDDDDDEDDGDDDDDSDDDDEETSSTTYEAVDLGDGVSVLWATMNVGASSVEDYGNYYAWGEITVSSDGSYGSNSGFKLYGDSSATDFSGNASYDAATYNWGSSWRMPTRAEMTELFAECSTYETTTYNGVYGCLITGTNGKTIFLPSGGYYDTYGFSSAGGQGLYWTSTPTGSNRGAYGLKTTTITSSSATYSIGSHTRSNGYLIRAVHDKEDSSSE